MAALHSWRKAYGALKDTTTVSLANLNSDFKVRRRILTHPSHGFPPILRAPNPVQFMSVGRALAVGSVAALLRCTGFIDSLWGCGFCFLRIWMSRS